MFSKEVSCFAYLFTPIHCLILLAATNYRYLSGKISGVMWYHYRIHKMSFWFAVKATNLSLRIPMKLI